MPITKDKLNNDLQFKLNRAGLKTPAIEEFNQFKETKLVKDATVLGKSAGQVVNGFESLENKLDFSGAVNTTGDVVTRITENAAGYGVLKDLNDITVTIPNNGYDALALQADINTLLTADSDTDLTGMFSSVGSIGGGVADTISNVIKLITLLGALSKLATNISISGSATDAISAAGKSVASKASGIAGSINNAVGSLGDFADVSSLSELTGVAKNFGQNISGVVSAVSAVKNFNPLAEAIGAVTNINPTGLGGVIGDIGNTINNIDRGINDITKTINNIAENGLDAVTGAVLGKAGNILGPINNTLIKSSGGVIQNVNEAFNSEFTKNIIQIAGGALVSKDAVSSLMDKVTSKDPVQFAQAAKSISQISNKIPNSMKGILSGISDNDFSSPKELIDNVLTKAKRNKVSQSDIDSFISEFTKIENTISTLDTTVQSTLERTNNQFYTENVNLTTYGSEYPEVQRKLSPQEYNDFARELQRKNQVDWLSYFPTQESLDEYVRSLGGTSALVDFAITSTLSHLKGRVAGVTRPSRETRPQPNPSSGVPKFTTIDSKEELSQEIMLAKRGILYLTIHSTESFNNQYLTSLDIHNDHIERGFAGIQYHYIIRKDGTLERGMPVDRVTQASPRDIRNFVIDIALVGGINASSGVENPDQYKSIESYTRAQMDTLESFIDSFYRRYPGGIVQGHNQIEDNIEDPNFDVAKYIRNRFGR